MRPPRFTVAPQQRVFVRLDEDQRNRMIFLEMLQQLRQLFELQALARVHQQSGSREVAFPYSMQFSKNRDKVHRQVIYAVEAHILEGPQNRAFSRTGEPCKDDELARVPSGSRGRLHRKAAQLFTRR